MRSRIKPREVPTATDQQIITVKCNPPPLIPNQKANAVVSAATPPPIADRVIETFIEATKMHPRNNLPSMHGG